MIISEVALWSSILSTSRHGKIMESAFLSIAVAVEKYLAEKFIMFATDPCSPLNSVRAIKIDDRAKFTALIKGDNSQFVDYNRAIDRCSSIVFEKNPFQLINSDIRDALSEVKAIRNYLAHRSDESRERYIKISLNGGAYKDVYEYLQDKRARSRIDNYERLIQKLQELEEIFEHPNFAATVALLP